jgi:hypothetical protein
VVSLAFSLGAGEGVLEVGHLGLALGKGLPLSQDLLLEVVGVLLGLLKLLDPLLLGLELLGGVSDLPAEIFLLLGGLGLGLGEGGDLLVAVRGELALLLVQEFLLFASVALLDIMQLLLEVLVQRLAKLGLSL